ncbi:hypothetical protein FA15DRAFT_711028 [Coprinopsis marcescibilis]|uniref:Alpha-type protein kinase domain-containing protein n=1 Tax=Coprinopsis marcescibilis TaxID=230819 RepID=A0A5C3KB11_COPMA|nr:hypothetical protein FA15DRAFT_711028 [Coprinopsis marcescibilis]
MRESSEYEEVMKWPQCIECGQSWRNATLNNANACANCGPGDTQVTAGRGECVIAVERYRGSQAVALEDTTARRSESLFQSLKPSTAAAVTSALTTEVLQARENIMRGVAAVNSGKRTDAVVVDIKYRLSGKPRVTADIYGMVRAAFNSETTLWDVQDRALKQFNVVWTKNGQIPIVVGETTLRQQDNRLIDQDMLGSTLHEYLAQLIDMGFSTAPTSVSRFGKKGLVHGKRVVPFELFIMEHMFAERIEKLALTNSVPTLEAGKLNSKRNRTGSMASSMMAAPAKVARVGTGGFEFRSSFALPPRSTSHETSSIHLSTEITLKRIECMHLTADGCPIFVPKEQLKAFIGEAPIAHGSMKVVFELTLSDSKTTTKYVVKRFYKLEDSGSDNDDDTSTKFDFSNPPFTVDEHTPKIRAECVRLAQGAQFLKDFYKACQQKGVSVYDYLRFAHSSLLQECGEVSQASGMRIAGGKASNALDLDTEHALPGFTWLMEERHASGRIERFSGTLQHSPLHSDITHLTVYAFAHFVYEFTGRQIVLADLQGTPTLLRHSGERIEGVLIFDPMTHTLNQGSGIGDCGVQGINSFLEQHQCGRICEQLGLSQPGEADLLTGANSRSSSPTDSDKDPTEGNLDKTPEPVGQNAA